MLIPRTSRNVHIEFTDTSSSETLFVSDEASRRLTNIFSMPNFFNSAAIDVGGTLQPMEVGLHVVVSKRFSCIIFFFYFYLSFTPSIFFYSYLSTSTDLSIPPSIFSPSIHPPLFSFHPPLHLTSLPNRMLHRLISQDALAVFP